MCGKEEDRALQSPLPSSSDPLIESSQTTSTITAIAKFYKQLQYHTMASTVMASTTPSKILSSLPNPKLPAITKPLALLKSLPKPPTAVTLTAAAAAAAITALPLPALAAEIEKAALFDFNLTLPAIAAEFLFLMVALDKLYFTPLGNFMDERDAAIRAKLGDVKDTSSEVKQLDDQAAAVMKAARAEVAAALNQMKKETTAELEAKLQEGRKRVEAELAEALQALELQKEETIKALDSQIVALSQDIVKKVLPTA